MQMQETISISGKMHIICRTETLTTHLRWGPIALGAVHTE